MMVFRGAAAAVRAVATAALVAGATAVAAQDVPVEKAVQSKVFYNLRGGQTVLVPADGEIGRSPEAIRAPHRRYDNRTLIWGIQPAAPPAGLTMVTKGPLRGKNFYDSSNTGTGSVRMLLVDPATGLIHYYVISGSVLGFGNFLPVPASAVDLRNGRLESAQPDMELMDQYSKSELKRKYPPAKIDGELISAAVAMIPTSALAEMGGSSKSASATPGALGDPAGRTLTGEGDMVGLKVMGGAGQTVGAVDLVSVEKASGEVDMAFVAVPFLGPDKHIAVPAQELKRAGDHLVLDLPPAAIVSRPSYSKADLAAHYKP